VSFDKLYVDYGSNRSFFDRKKVQSPSKKKDSDWIFLYIYLKFDV